MPQVKTGTTKDACNGLGEYCQYQIHKCTNVKARVPYAFFYKQSLLLSTGIARCQVAPNALLNWYPPKGYYLPLGKRIVFVSAYVGCYPCDENVFSDSPHILLISRRAVGFVSVLHQLSERWMLVQIRECSRVDCFDQCIRTC